MRKLTLYTSVNCVKCPTAHKLLMEVVQEYNLKQGIDYKIIMLGEDEEIDLEALMNNVVITPAFTLDGVLFCQGKIPSKQELVEEMNKK